MQYIDGRAIRRAMSFPALVDLIEKAHGRGRIDIEEGMMGAENGHYFVRHAVDPGRFMCSKLITSFPGNLDRGELPAVQAVCILFDGTDGRPLAVIDGTEITYWRTAADSALGSRLLSREDSETLLVVGAGAMSGWLVRAHRSVRPSLRRIIVWNRSRERGEAFVETLRSEGLQAQSSADLDAAVAQADIITTCTRSHQPLIHGRAIKEGTHLDLVGGYTEHTREADDETVRRSRLFVDRMESAFAGVGDILQPIRDGVIGKDDIVGDLYDLVGGHAKGRTSPSQITLFKNAGGGHFDLIASEAVYNLLGKPL